MKKVLILANSINGLYSFRRELIQTLIDSRYEVIIAAPKGDKINFFKGIGSKYIDTPINGRGKNPFTDTKLTLNYIKILNSTKPDVVLTYTIKPNVYGGLACRLLNIPYITNMTGLGSAVENKGLLQKLTLFLYKISLKYARCVFFQNKENQQFMEKRNIATKNHKLIPGSGVNLDHFKLIEYPETDKKIEFLFIGRVMKEKGIDQYLEAAKYIKNKFPNTVFHILGNCEESYIEKLKEMQEKGTIIYHGRQNDVREYHRISHCTIHPTYYPEGMSNVLLESAASGRPVIATNRSGCREIIDDGINGYLVEQKNSQYLINKIEDFLHLDHKLKEKMGIAGRKKVEKEFDRNIVIDAYMEVIRKVI